MLLMRCISAFLVTCLLLVATQSAAAQRTVRAPQIGTAEDAPDTVYYESDYFDYVDARLDDLDEPSLWKLSRDPNAEGYRFFWVPDEGVVHMVRLDVGPTGIAELTYKQSSGVTAESWGTVAESKSRKLTEKEFKEFQFRFGYMRFWHMKTEDAEDPANSIGPLWLAEATHRSKYHAVYRTNPMSGELKKLGDLLLSFVEMTDADVSSIARPTRSSRPTPPDVTDPPGDE